MDLSLVLASQAIEHVIDRPDEQHGWQVTVSSADHFRALESWAAYRAENKGRRWQRPLPFTGLIFDWRSAVWFAVLAVLFVFGETRLTHLREAGLMDSQAVQHGQWWRLFTAVSLHGDAPHLIANLTTGVLLLGLAMGTFGSGLAVLASYLAGVGGNLAGYWIYDLPHRSLGASGMVMGSLGLLTGQSLVRSGQGARQLIVRGILGGALLLVLLGLDPSSDVIGHVGGFASGVLLGALLALLNGKLAQNALANRMAELFCALLIVVTWALALRAIR